VLIHDARLITWGRPNEILEGQAVLLADGRIKEIGPQAELLRRHPQEDQLDGAGQLLMPGNICAHTHFYGAFARGMAIPGRPPRDFPDILRKLWWPLDKSLTLDDVRASAEVCLIDAIRHGTTTLIDHHASPNAIDGSLDVIAEAVDRSGLRAVLCYEVTDRDGRERARAGIRENVRFLQRCAGGVAGGRVAGLFGLHAGLTLSDETLDACRWRRRTELVSTSTSLNTRPMSTTAWRKRACASSTASPPTASSARARSRCMPSTSMPAKPSCCAQAAPGSPTNRVRT
jgi:cytosine/adenosine deaminase-related metal-dependent hydrolase